MTTPTDEITTDEQADKLFSEAFREAAGIKEASVPTTEVTPALEVKEDAPVVAATVDTPSVKTDDKIDPKAAVTQPATETAKAVRNDIPDWAKDLAPELQDKIAGTIQYHQQRYNSDIGRQSAYQRRLMDANRRIAELSTQVTKPQDPNLAAAAKQDQAKTAEEWKQLNEADPSLAKAVDSRVSAESESLRQEIAGLKQAIKATVDPLYQQSQETYLDKQHKILLDVVPNYQEVANHPVYAYWVNQKASPGIRQLANTSSEAADAITVFQMYAGQAEQTYKEMIAKGLLKDESPAHTTEAPAATVQNPSQTDTALADQVVKSRETKIQSAAPTKQQPSPIASPRVNALAGGKPGDEFDIDSPEVAALFSEVFNKSVRR